MTNDLPKRLREASTFALMDAARATVLEAADALERGIADCDNCLPRNQLEMPCLRDTFAAAALAGLTANGDYSVESTPVLAWRMADAMLRERHKNSAEETSGSGSVTPANRGTTPPRNGALSGCETVPDPDSRVWETPRTPQTQDTPTQGSVQEERSFRVSRNANEPVAWGVAGRTRLFATSTSRIDAVDMQSKYACDTEVVPLYRSPTLTDGEREAVEWFTEGESPFPEEEHQMAVLRGLLERMGGER